MLIKEDFIHYLWQHKLFNFANLKTTNNEAVLLINSGKLNTNSGPDFFNAQLKIDQQLWAGNVEIHVKASDWFVHHHEVDTAYDSVILHVVWEDDMAIHRQNNDIIPTLVLKNYVPKAMLRNYKELFSKEIRWVNCEKDIKDTDTFILDNWIERLYFERLHQKSSFINALLKKSNNDWESVLFQLLAKNFGLKVNGESFVNLAQSFDFSILRKSQNNRIKMEALLFGQAGLLANELEDAYYQNLQKEYRFLQVKHQIEPIFKGEIKFFRLRPNNFPTIRLSQLATLFVSTKSLFSKIMTATNIEDIYNLFQVETSVYWKTHYTFGKEVVNRKKKLTKSFIDLVLINTIIPLKFVYQNHLGKLKEEEILTLIKHLKPEQNNIIKKFKTYKINAINAFETQALLQLKNEYCNKQKCLQCAIGNYLLKST